MWQVLVWQWLVRSAPLPTVALWDGYGIALPSNGLVRNTRRTTEKRCEVSEDTGLRRLLSDEVVRIWRSESFVVICSSEWGIVRKRTRNAFFHKGAYTSPFQLSYSTKTSYSNWNCNQLYKTFFFPCSENRYNSGRCLLQWTFLRLSLILSQFVPLQYVLQKKLLNISWKKRIKFNMLTPIDMHLK